MCKELLNTVSLKITTADIGIIAGFRSQVRGEERRKEERRKEKRRGEKEEEKRKEKKGESRERMKLNLKNNDKKYWPCTFDYKDDCNNVFNFNFIHGRC